MPRRRRLYIAGLPYHVVQRGNNREAVFYKVDDYKYYLELLSELLGKYGVRLHAYVLMTNHIHFLVTPLEQDSISNLTKVLGSRFAHYMNKTYGRTGTLWEGRHKSSVVDTEQYLLKCYRYIEMNPVSAYMVEHPEEYKWSSYGVNAWLDKSDIVDFHDEYAKLGINAEERAYAYRELFGENLNDQDLHNIRRASHYCQPLGSEEFRRQIEDKLGVKLGQGKRGRPRRVVDQN